MADEELTNGLDEEQVNAIVGSALDGLATVASTGSYKDLVDVPAISATIEMLSPGESAVVNVNDTDSSKVFGFGIPASKEIGGITIDAFCRNDYERNIYSGEKKGFVVVNTTTGNLYFKTSDEYGKWSTPVKIKGEKGDRGSIRFSTLTSEEKSQLRGRAATMRVGQIITLLPDEEAFVSNVGTVNDGVLNFGIPKGEQGDKGCHYVPSVDDDGFLRWEVMDGSPEEVMPTNIRGPQGVSINYVENTPSNENGGLNVVTVYFDNGTSNSFEIKNGEKGDVGTVGIGTVTLTDDTENAVVSAVNVESGVNLDFTIPRGLTGVRGTKWFSGTGLAGTGGNLAISVADDNDYIAGDMYLNTDSSSIYECIVGGRYDSALWNYKCNNKGNDFEIDGVGLLSAKPLDARIGYTYYVKDSNEADYDGKLIVKIGSGVNDWSEPVDFKGEKGDTGDKGDKGDKGEKGDKGDKGDSGGIMYATFDIDSSGHLIMKTDEDYAGPQFRLVEGRLEVVL